MRIRRFVYEMLRHNALREPHFQSCAAGSEAIPTRSPIFAFTTALICVFTACTSGGVQLFRPQWLLPAVPTTCAALLLIQQGRLFGMAPILIFCGANVTAYGRGVVRHTCPISEIRVPGGNTRSALTILMLGDSGATGGAAGVSLKADYLPFAELPQVAHYLFSLTSLWLLGLALSVIGLISWPAKFSFSRSQVNSELCI